MQGIFCLSEFFQVFRHGSVTDQTRGDCRRYRGELKSDRSCSQDRWPRRLLPNRCLRERDQEPVALSIFMGA